MQFPPALGHLHPTLEVWRENASWWLERWRANMYSECPGPESLWGQFALMAALGPNVLEGLTKPDQQTLTISTHFFMRWAALEYPTFVLSHGLTAKLLLTDCHGLTIEDLKWPFDSFVIRLPGTDPFISYIDGITGKAVPASFISVHRFKTQSPNSRESVPIDELDRALKMFSTSALHVATQSTDSQSTLTRMHVEPASDETMREFLDNSTMDQERITPGFHTAKLDGAAQVAVARLVVNLAVYLADQKARQAWDADDPSNRKQRERHPGLVVPKRWNVGNEIKVAPELRRAAVVSEEAFSPAWRLEARFVVRGHWRNQAHGPARSLRRKQWIEPHWKGPEEGERLERAYRVSDD